LSDPTQQDGPPGGLTAGRVGRPHGLDGSFYVTRPRPRLLEQGIAVRIGDRESKIVRRAGTDRRPIVRLDGIEGREAAEELRGLDIAIVGADVPALAEGEWWAHELEGCAVLDGDRLLGTVASLIELPSCEVLEVKRAQGGEPLLVPMVKDAIVAIEAPERRVRVEGSFLGLETDPPHEQGGRETQAEGS
jgi:16S rRNA processing protein RimM